MPITALSREKISEVISLAEIDHADDLRNRGGEGVAISQPFQIIVRPREAHIAVMRYIDSLPEQVKYEVSAIARMGRRSDHNYQSALDESRAESVEIIGSRISSWPLHRYLPEGLARHDAEFPPEPPPVIREAFTGYERELEMGDGLGLWTPPTRPPSE